MTTTHTVAPRRAAASRRRPLRAALLPALAIAAGATCRDRSLTGPGLPARATLAVAPAPSPQLVTGGPALVLQRVRAVLHPVGSTDSLVQVADFTGDSVVLQFDVTVTGGSGRFRVRLDGIDAAGDTLFRGTDTVTAVAGADVRPAALPMAYVGADAAITDFVLLPADTVLGAPDTLRLRALPVVAATTTPLRLGWTSRDTQALQVSAGGVVRPRALERAVWVVARLFNGVADSALVHVRAPVSAVVLARDTASVQRGDTVRLVAEPRDSLGAPMIRPVTWAALDAGVTVDPTGLVTATTARVVARVVAASGTKADTATITTLPRAVAAVTVAPDSATLAVGGATAFAATVLDAGGLPNGDWTAAWSVADTTIAIVDAAGLVTARANGRTTVYATAGGVRDSAAVRVQPLGPVVTAVVVTPLADTASALGDTLLFAAQAYDGTTPIAGVFAWTVRDTAVARVDAVGRVVAVGNGTTDVVATEAGGVRDSARVVVQQVVSSVSVTPAVVQRYLGTTQQFVATAVDGRGNAMPFARFVWSSTAAATVAVDTTGLATMAGLGTATVRATAGAVSGQASVTVVTPITRIAVTPDTLTVDALGTVQGYSAVAYDTLNAPMAGVAVAWASSNPSVAALGGTTATTTNATTLANGTTRIRATAQGVTGEATLNVKQTLAAIELTPATGLVAPGGRLALLARGRDPRGQYLTTSPTFGFTADSTAYATVDAGGIVTGVAPGRVRVTARGGPQDAIVSNEAIVDVQLSGVPAVVTFGRDTLGVGRGTTASIPVYLTVPSATAPVIVDFAAADTFAYFPQPRDTFPAGATSINVPLAGRSAGTTRVVATPLDAAWAGDTAVVTVQANVRFATTALNMVAGDQRDDVVRLSDPAPAGGVFVTYAHGTPGIAEISPDPAYVPAGLLEAPVVVKGIGAGRTTVSLSAAGVSGANTLTVDVQPATLAFYYGPPRVGAGQYAPNANWLYAQTTLGFPLTVTLASSDTTVARMQSPLLIAAGSQGVNVTPRGFVPGVATFTASAPGFASATMPVTVTTPRVGICCAATLNTTSAPYGMTVYAQDSAGGSHPRLASLRVTLRSRDTTVARADSVATIAADQQQATFTVRAVGGGSTWVVTEAGGHTSDSVRVTVQAPQLAIYYGATTIGEGRSRANANYVYIPNAVSVPVTVTLTPADSTIGRPQRSVIIPAGSTGASFAIEGYQLGTTTYTASAPGYATASQAITVVKPRVAGSGAGSYVTYQTPFDFTVYARDSVGNGDPVLAPVTVTVTSSDTSVVRVDSAATTLAAGRSQVSGGQLRIGQPGSAQLVLAAPGHLPDTVRVTVDSAAVTVYYGVGVTGAGQLAENANYIYVPNARADTVVITATARHPEVLSMPSRIVIPPGSTGVSFSWEGVAPGADTVVFGAPGYRSTSRVFPVSRRLLRGRDLPASLATTAAPFQLDGWTVDTVGTQRPVADTVTIQMVSTDTAVLRLDSAYVHLPRGQSTSTRNTARIVGPGTARVVYLDSTGRMAPDTSTVVTVTGPALGMYYGGAASVGMRQVARNANLVTIPNAVASPLTVTLTSSAENVLRSSTVIIPAGQTSAWFDVTGGDTTGTVRLVATATGYQSTSTDVRVGRPRLRIATNATPTTTTPAGTATVYALDQDGNQREPLDTVRVTFASSQPGVAVVDSASVLLLPGQSSDATARVRYLSTGTTSIAVGDPRTGFTAYAADSAAVTVALPTITVYYGPQSTGIGQYVDNYVSVTNAVADTLKLAVRHDASRATLPDTIVLPPGTTGASFRSVGLTSGVDTVGITAPGHAPATTTVTVGRGTIALSNWPGTLAAGDSVQLWLNTRDQAGNGRNVASDATFTLAPSAGLRFADAQGGAITTVVVRAGNSQSAGFWVHGMSSGTGSVTVASTDYQSATYSTAVP